MIVSASLLFTAVVLCAVGGILMLTRPLTRILLGAVIIGNGINLLVLSSTGAAGEAPLLYGVPFREVTDPLPQAIALTAIVITLATTSFLLAMAYRSHQITGSDEVHDDLEDRRIALRVEVMDERAQLREEYRTGDAPTEEERDRYRERRRHLRHRLRADRALQARGRSATGNLWHDVLGADPEDYAAADAEAAEARRDAARAGGHAPDGGDHGSGPSSDDRAPAGGPGPAADDGDDPGSEAPAPEPSDPAHPDSARPDAEHPDAEHPDPEHPDPKHPDPEHPDDPPAGDEPRRPDPGATG
nr:Na(+)/H(+) antiporter subunit C [uncultured Streptomyces sp.]